MNVISINECECSVCYVNKVELSLLCKHSLCKSCYNNIEICPFCRKRIKPKRNEITIPDTNVNVRINNENSTNEYCVLCIMFFAPVIWFLFLVSAIISI